MLYVSYIASKGRGVLTSKTIKRDTIIERCPVIVVHPEQIDYLQETALNDYYFCWGKNQKSAAITLGFGSMYNHSYTPNALYRPCLDEQIMEIVAIKTILSNEEITFNYNGSPNDKTPLWGCDTIEWMT